MACEEHPIFFLVGLERLELWSRPALLVVFDMLGHEIRNKGLYHIQLEIIFVVKFLTLLRLQECEIVRLVAFRCDSLFHLLLTHQLHLKKNTLLQICLKALDSLLCLKIVFNIKLPFFLAIDGGVERIFFQFKEVFALGCFCHGFYNY